MPFVPTSTAIGMPSTIGSRKRSVSEPVTYGISGTFQLWHTYFKMLTTIQSSQLQLYPPFQEEIEEIRRGGFGLGMG